MCGFTGFIDFSGKKTHYQQILENCYKQLSFRGPDENKKLIDEVNSIFISFERLSFFDLSDSGMQPMISKNNRYIFFMNGEIYNFKNLAHKLQILKIDVNNKSDAAVALEFISNFGLKNFLNNVDGMFAIVLIDLHKKEINFLSDPFSQKPLYYSIQRNSIYFSSDLRTIHFHQKFDKEIDMFSVQEYFKKSFISAPKTIYKNVFKLEQSSNIIISFKDGTIKLIDETKYHSFEPPKEQNYNRKLNIEQIINNIEKSVSLQLESDTPIGTFLSSGTDSSLITSIASKYNKNIKAFSLGFKNPEFDESRNARLIADHLNIDLSIHYFDEVNINEKVYNTSSTFSEPFSDSSQIPYKEICEFSSKTVKGVLSGDGGDEIFGGYHRYVDGVKIYKITRNKFINKIFQLLLLFSKNIVSEYFFKLLGYSYPLEKIDRLKKSIKANNIDEFYDLITSYFHLHHIVRNLTIVNNDFKNTEYFDYSKYLMWKDLTSYLPNDLLVKSDRASMFCSLEVRSPFLNKDIVKNVNLYGSDEIFHGGKRKSIQKKILRNYLPPSLIQNKKKGFVAPIDKWLKKDLNKLCDYYFSKKMMSHDLFDNKILNQNIKNFKRGKPIHSEIWSLLIFQIWFHSYH